MKRNGSNCPTGRNLDKLSLSLKMREENHFVRDAWKQTKMREFHGNCGKLGRSAFRAKTLRTNTLFRGLDSCCGVAHDNHVKRVSQCSAESRGSSSSAPVSSHKECWQGGLGLAPNSPFHRSCAPWSDMSHKVAARGALRKSSTRSGWAASVVIQLSSQLQVRMISTFPLTY